MNQQDKNHRDIEIIVENQSEKSQTSHQQNSDTANQQPEAPKRKRVWLNSIFLLAICAVSIFIMVQLALTFNDGEIKPIGQLIEQTDWLYAGIAIAVLALLIAVDGLKFVILIRLTTQKTKPLTGLKVSLLGKYYDCITPFQSGGQPMQIYYLHKKGLSTGNASVVVFSKYAFQIFAWLVVTTVLFISGSSALDMLGSSTATLLRVGGWIGLAVTALLPIGLVAFSLMPKVLTAVLDFFVKIGKKLRLIKDPKATHDKILKVVKDYSGGFGLVAKKPVALVTLGLICFLEPIATLVFPYFVLMAFAGNSIVASGLDTALQVMALHVYALFSVSVIPTPGNSGFVETSFTLAFQYIAGAVLFWVVFTWRFLTYYIYIVIGIGINIFELIRNAVRNARARNDEP